MQRNMDLVRTILMRLEALPKRQGSPTLGIEGYPAEWVAYHARIMKQEGLIEVVDTSDMHSLGPEAIPTGLTWKGHEFLDLARDPERWQRATAIIGKVGGAPIAVWMKVLTDLMLEGVERVTTKRG